VILGRKIKMAQIFDEKGNAIPVTFVLAGPCKVLDVKTKEKDGYFGVKLGFEEIENKKIKKSKKHQPFKVIKEFRAKSEEDLKDFKEGQEINVSSFQEKEKVCVAGTTKGKGFQGGVKRWGFSGRNATHGMKHEERTLGSVGSTRPARVIKGKKMPGRTGGERLTIKNLEIVKIFPKENIIAIKGAVPGRKGTLLEIVKREKE
jgi:large subunit ribosomal protein L3